MDTRRVVRIGAVVAILMTALVGCSGEGGVPSGDLPFTLRLEPEFVQGVIPGAVTGVLVMVESESFDPVALTATATDAEVTVTPGSIVPAEVAEVWVVAAPGSSERPIDIVVTGRRGDTEVSDARSTSVLPWEDDRGEYAGKLLGLFTTWLEANRPDLGITPATTFSGSFVAPGLLVVSHYMFLSEEWEIGLSWHVMVPPDDWADIYLRSRGDLKPTLGFRLSSQDAALTGGVVDISEVAPPLEVVR